MRNVSGIDAETQKKMVATFRGYTKPSAKFVKQIRELGFTIEITKNHNKLFYRDCPIPFTMSKTPSDGCRAGQKFIHILIREVNRWAENN